MTELEADKSVQVTGILIDEIIRLQKEVQALHQAILSIEMAMKRRGEFFN